MKSFKKIAGSAIFAVSASVAFASVANGQQPQSSQVQSSSETMAMYCEQNDNRAMKIVMSDLFFIVDNGKSSYENAHLYSPNFREFVKPEGLGEGSVLCHSYRPSENASAQSEWQKRINYLREVGYTVIEVKGWHPVKPHGLRYVASTGAMAAKPTPAPVASTKRDSLIVRDLGQAPAKPVVAAKPAATVKPAAKPAPPAKKKWTGCGRKGQPNCRAKPM